MVESANLGRESADSSTDSNANPTEVGVWVRALMQLAVDPLQLRPQVRAQDMGQQGWGTGTEGLSRLSYWVRRC